MSSNPARAEPGWSRRRPTAERSRGDQLGAAVSDAVEGLRQWPQWFTLGNLDIKLRFRRSGLGPFWSALSFSVIVAAIGLVYSQVLEEPIIAYVPWLALGMLVWNFLANTVQEGCEAFVQAEHVLKQLRLPLTVLVYRALWRNLLLFAFNLIAAAAMLAAVGAAPPRAAPLALAGLALLGANLAWIVLLLALATARYRAIARIVQTLVPIGMLVTPVIWRPATVELRGLAEWNPLYFAIELVRGPILGSPPAPGIWAAAAGSAVLGSATALIIFALARTRLRLWL